MTIKTFRGLIADGGQDTIVLHTNDGSTGYRIVKFELFNPSPGAVNFESVVKIYKVDQKITASNPTTGTVDFSDQTLLAAAYLADTDSPAVTTTHIVTFDKEIFNQDIYVTHKDIDTGIACNYYIELEQVKLALDENTVATLKDIRNTARIPTT